MGFGFNGLSPEVARQDTDQLIPTAADQARKLAGDTFDRARERYPDAQRVYQRGNEALRPHAQESPLGLAILAGAIGYLLALVIHGRR